MGETIDAACRQDTQSCCCRSAELLARYEFDSLEKWLYSSEAHSLPLRGVEVAEQRRGRELLHLLLQAHVVAVYLSKDFEEYWDWHISQDQERLYPKARWEPVVTVVLK